MEIKTFVRLLCATVPTTLLFFLQGCATNGYISSNITTGIGLDVSENPQTQVPHVRFGYIRNGLYYIPTGKTGNPGGDASQTPHLVSKIHVSSEFLKGVDISEKFAVGDAAVRSGSAQILFQDTSTERARSSAPPDTLPPIPTETPAPDFSPPKPTPISDQAMQEQKEARRIRNERAVAVKAFNSNLRLIFAFSSPAKENALAEIAQKASPLPPPNADGPVKPTFQWLNAHFQNTHTPVAEQEAMAVIAAGKVKQAQQTAPAAATP